MYLRDLTVCCPTHMEIHILRDGNQIGPFSEETVQSLLKQGNVLINDLAWMPGLDTWSPLHAVLYPAAQPPTPPPNAVPPPMPGAATDHAPVQPVVLDPLPPAASTVAEEPATARQKAFLTFMAVPFGSDLNKNRAAHLVNDVMENPKNSGRLRRWEEERLRLYPDLFADEIKARRENRSQQFLEICQGEGEEFFDGVTKAHTQVLVAYLDVQHPNWDQSDHAAKYDYFFPAIAEKFPQLLKRAAKGRFKYPDGPKVAAELVRRPVAVRGKAKRSPVAAMMRGIFIGAILLGLGYGAIKLQQNGGIEAVKAFIAKATEQAKAAPGKTADSKATKPSEKTATLSPASSLPSTPNPPTETVSAPPALAQASPVAPDPLAPPATQPAPAAVAPAPAPAPVTTAPADSTMAANTAPASALPSNVSLFDTTPPPATTPAADPLAPPTPSPATPAPAATTPKAIYAKVTKQTVINLRFGTSTLRPGTPVQVLSSSGSTITIKFGPETVTIPAANTDYGSSGSMLPGPTGQ